MYPPSPRGYFRRYLFVLSLCWSWLVAPAVHAMTRSERLKLRDLTQQEFNHAFDGYMRHAFPEDELRPLSCQGRSRVRNPSTISDAYINDVLGNFSLTLVDSLDTLALMGDRERFAEAIFNVIDVLPSFDIDSVVQVFEVTIRMLGGLLSAHMIASDEGANLLGMAPVVSPNGRRRYSGELLGLAKDLGYRLLSAFEESPSATPYSKVNLRHGVPEDSSFSTCSAGVGTLLLEFAALSRLTNETIFEDVARMAMHDIWSERSRIDLIGGGYNIRSREWEELHTGTGAGIDSFFEYLLKAAIYLDDEDSNTLFRSAYASLLEHSYDVEHGYFFYNVDIHSARLMDPMLDSLSAFFPGLMVLAGHVEAAESVYLAYYHLWRRYQSIPESFNLFHHKTSYNSYPLRPEFIESTYYLYQATRDPFYLEVGRMVLNDLIANQKTACGYAAIQNGGDVGLTDRMESFFLSETLKYLYLLFDEDNVVNAMDSNFVFTTEGHLLLPLPKRSHPSRASGQWASPQRVLYDTALVPPSLRSRDLSFENIKHRLGLSRLLAGDLVRTTNPSTSSGNNIVAATLGGFLYNGTCPAVKVLNSPADCIWSPLVHLASSQSPQPLSLQQGVPLPLLRPCPSAPTLPLRTDFDLVGAMIEPHERIYTEVRLVSAPAEDCSFEYCGESSQSYSRPRFYHVATEEAYRVGLHWNAVCRVPRIARSENLTVHPHVPHLALASAPDLQATVAGDFWIFDAIPHVSFSDIIISQTMRRNPMSIQYQQVLAENHQQQQQQQMPLGSDTGPGGPPMPLAISPILFNKHIRPIDMIPATVDINNGRPPVMTDIIQVRVELTVPERVATSLTKIPSEVFDPANGLSQLLSGNVSVPPSLRPLTLKHEFVGRLAWFSEQAMTDRRYTTLLPRYTQVAFLDQAHPQHVSESSGCRALLTDAGGRHLRNKIVVFKKDDVDGCGFWDVAKSAADAGAAGVLIGTNSYNRQLEGGEELAGLTKMAHPLDLAADGPPQQQESPPSLSVPVVAMFDEVLEELSQYMALGIELKAKLF